MILSEIKTNKSNKVIVTQRLSIACDECNTEFSLSLLNQCKGIDIYNKDLCRSCKQKHQYKNGLRDRQKEHAANYASNIQKDKTYKEMYGAERAACIKQKLSDASSNDNPRWSLKHRTQEEINKAKKVLGEFSSKRTKGKTFNEIYGKEKADKIKAKLSTTMTGENNHMYGKPAPKGSGGGIDGWYKDFYFRSILELSFLLHAHKKDLVVVNAETNNFKVTYKVDKCIKNYFPDFYLPESNTVIEVKPSSRIDEPINLLKFNSAKKKFENFKILTEKDFTKISKKELKKLVDNNIVKLRNYLI